MTDASKPSCQPAQKLGNGELILIADDERSIRELLQMFFVSRGYRVLAAADGAEGFSLFHENRTEIKLVITDYNMPVMNGLRLFLKLREACPNLPILFYAAITDEPMARILDDLCQLSGVRFLPKPRPLTELAASASALLAKAAPSPVDS